MGWPEVILILVVLLVIFGAGKLPSIGTAIGGGIRELRQAADGKSDADSRTAVVAGSSTNDAASVPAGSPHAGSDAERRDAI